VNAKKCALHILAVGVVPNARDGMLVHEDFSTVLSNLLEIFIDVGDPNSVDGAGNDAFGAGDAAIDTWLALIASIDSPVFHRAFPFGDLPAKYIFVERGDLFGIIRADLKVLNPRHRKLLYQIDKYLDWFWSIIARGNQKSDALKLCIAHYRTY
jgi:hypothetical protein